MKPVPLWKTPPYAVDLMKCSKGGRHLTLLLKHDFMEMLDSCESWTNVAVVTQLWPF